MNYIIGKYTSKIFVQHPICKFDVLIDNCTVYLESVAEELTISINGKKKTDKLQVLLDDIEELIFFYNGSFPKIQSLVVNGEIVDLLNRVHKYITSKNFLKENVVICDINKFTVSQEIINRLREINQFPIYSLQYLVSESYDHVIVNHKMTLLLHVIEGLYDKSNKAHDKQEIRHKYPVPEKDKIGDYMAATYWLCKHYFFSYHRKFNSEILPLLKVTQYSFLQRLSDTRNWYSHFLEESTKVMKIRKGRDFVIYFEIIVYMIRLAVIDKLDLSVDEDRIKEFYYTVHDWILAIVYDKDSPLKSKTYKIVKAWDEFRSWIEELQKEYECRDGGEG